MDVSPPAAPLPLGAGAPTPGIALAGDPAQARSRFGLDQRLIDQHREVVEGIATGDVARAERSMRLHLQGILTDLPLIKQERPEYFL